MRNAAMPSTPTTGNRPLAMAAPRFCDTSEPASASIGSARAALAKPIARHRDAAEEVGLVIRARRGLGLRGAERHHQRQQVLLARMRETRGGRALPRGQLVAA